MSNVRFQCRTLFTGLILSCFGLLALTVPGKAQGVDPFNRIDQRGQLQSQKLSAEIANALSQVRDLESKNPTEALKILQVYKDVLENDNILTEQRRTYYLSQVNGFLTKVQRNTAVQKVIQEQQSQLAAQKAARQQYLEANPEAKKLYETMKATQEGLRYNKDTYERIQMARAQGFIDVMNDLDRSAIPQVGDVSFPVYWKQLKETRKLFAGPKLTEKEQQLLKSLNSVLSVDFDMASFEQVINYLQEVTNQVIIVDGASLREAQVDYEGTSISFKSPGKITFRTVLRKVLGDVGLAYILKDGTIQVVSPQVARNSLVVRSYPISDLIPAPDPRFGAFYNQAQGSAYAAQVAQTIMMSVEPSTWAINGGRGTIFYNPASQSLVISNSAEMHLGLAASMGR